MGVVLQEVGLATLKMCKYYGMGCVLLTIYNQSFLCATPTSREATPTPSESCPGQTGATGAFPTAMIYISEAIHFSLEALEENVIKTDH